MIPLVPGKYYPIYNRANGDEMVFRCKENYRFFLEKFNFYISPVADTFSFCLMPNHFHFLLRIKGEKEIAQNLEGQENIANQEIDKIISNQFSRFFNSYAKSFNKLYNRKGSLFIKNFKRKNVADNKYLLKLIHYIHHNPLEAGLCKAPEVWKHSSYHLLLSGNSDFISHKEVIELFGTAEGFIKAHHSQPEFAEMRDL